MEKIFENTQSLNTREEYDAVLACVKNLIREATNNGALDNPEADNDYIREIGRLSKLGAEYENEHIDFKHIVIRKKTPLIQTIEDTMYSRNIRQNQLAKALDINVSALSQIINGKRAISMRIAKKLHSYLNIDPRLLIEYA